MLAEVKFGLPSLEHFDLVHGGKSLSVDIDLTQNVASMRFGTRYGLFIKRLPGETTTIFRLGEVHIQKAADQSSHTITLTLDTADDHLKLWLINKGPYLGFESIDPDVPTAFRETGIKHYYPHSLN